MSSYAIIDIQYFENNMVSSIKFSPEGKGSATAQSIYDSLNSMQAQNLPKSAVDTKLDSLIQAGQIRLLSDTAQGTVLEVIT